MIKKEIEKTFIMLKCMIDENLTQLNLIFNNDNSFLTTFNFLSNDD